MVNIAFIGGIERPASSYQVELIQRAADAPPGLFEWWSAHTDAEPHMTRESPDSLATKLLVGVFVQVPTDGFIAAAGVFPARTQSGEEIFHNGKRVVELGSNIVLRHYRNRHIGRRLVKERVEIAQRNDWQPVTVTTNPAAQTVLRRLGAQPMENDPDYRGVRELLCYCTVISSDCMCCPHRRDAAWFF